MTTIITRLFEDKSAAEQAKDRLHFRGLPGRAMSVIAEKPGQDIKDAMAFARVHPTAVDTYAAHVAKGRALLVVRATYKPLTAATITRELLEKFETIDVGDVTDDYFEADGPERAPSILDDHPLFLTIRMDRTGYEGAPVSHGLGLRLLSPRKTRDSAIKGGGHKSTMFWPMPLLSKKERKKSVISGGRYVSQAFWPTPLLSKQPRRNKVIKGGDHPLSNALGWPTTS